MGGRDEELKYAKQHNIPVLQTSKSPYSYDENMWSNTAEGGEIENPELTAPLDRILRWCKTPQQAADKVDTVTLEFEKGIPVAMDGKKLELWDLIMQLNKRAGANGCGFHQIVEDRIVGLKVRGVYENPAASVLIAAHKKLEYLVSTREENEFKNGIDQKWAYLCYGAKYFEPTMKHIRAYLESQNERVTGTAKVTLYKGGIWVASTSSPYSLFNSSLTLAPSTTTRLGDSSNSTTSRRRRRTRLGTKRRKRRSARRRQQALRRRRQRSEPLDLYVHLVRAVGKSNSTKQRARLQTTATCGTRLSNAVEP